MSLAAWQIGFSVLAGLVLFLYGIEHFSREIQAVAGDRFRGWLGRFTRNPLRGAVLGAVATTVVQSSSATTVIAVSLVDAGTISFVGSLGIIFGANVGTTVTAQLVALKLTAFAPFFLVLGFAVSLFGRRYRVLGRPLFYFGLVFFALALVSETLDPLKNDPRIVELLGRHASLPMGLLAGIVVTVLVQSSSVTTGLVVLLASAGLLSLGQAIPILLGANIGTSSTALLAAARMSLHARRAAVAHLLFNLGGVVLFLPVLVPLESFVASLEGDASQQVANAHFVFNGVCALVFLLVARPFARLVERLVPGEESEILLMTRHLPRRLPDEVPEAFRLIEAELGHLFDVTQELFREAVVLLSKPSSSSLRAVDRLEALNDFLDERVEQALLELSRRELSERQARRVVMLVRVSNVLEQLGDTGADLGRLASAAMESGQQLAPLARSDLEEVGSALDLSFDKLQTAFPLIAEQDRAEHRASQRALRALVNDKYSSHVRRLASEASYLPAYVVDALSLVEVASSQLREIRKQLENPVEVKA